MSTTETERPGLVARVMNTVDSVLRRATATREAEAAAAEQRQLTLRDEYLAILCRAEDPQAGDEQRLEQLIDDLALTADAVKADTNRVVRIKAAIAKAVRLDEHAEEFRQAIADRKELEARHKDEMKAALSRQHQADINRSRANDAAQTLRTEYARNPEFFGPLEFPANVNKPEQKAPPVERKCPKRVFVLPSIVGTQEVEPLIGPDGHYIQNADGAFQLPGGRWFNPNVHEPSPQYEKGAPPPFYNLAGLSPATVPAEAT